MEECRLGDVRVVEAGVAAVLLGLEVRGEAGAVLAVDPIALPTADDEMDDVVDAVDDARVTAGSMSSHSANCITSDAGTAVAPIGSSTATACMKAAIILRSAL